MLLTMNLGYTVKSIQKGPCSHEAYVLEKETDNKHRKKISGSDESDGGHKTGPCDGKQLQSGEQVAFCNQSMVRYHELMAFDLSPQG